MPCTIIIITKHIKKMNNISIEIAQAIKDYAKDNGISLSGEPYQTYSMLKYPSQNFPDGKMFSSNNTRGKLGNKTVIIVALNSDTISHFKPDYVLERPKDITRYIPRAHRFITQSFDVSVSF